MTPSTGMFPFPAHVVGPDGTELRLTRIGVAPGDPPRLRIFTSSGGVVSLHREVTIAAFDQVPVSPLRPRRPSQVITDDEGGVWTITKGAGCGCGDPLKRFDPNRWQASPPT